MGLPAEIIPQTQTLAGSGFGEDTSGTLVFVEDGRANSGGPNGSTFNENISDYCKIFTIWKENPVSYGNPKI